MVEKNRVITLTVDRVFTYWVERVRGCLDIRGGWRQKGGAVLEGHYIEQVRVTIVHLRVTIGHPTVTTGHLRVTISHIRVTISYFRSS